MTYKERSDRASVFLDNIWDTLNKKGNDYASDQDAFSNFTNTALVNKVRTEKVFLMEITKKISRINELLEKEAQFESIYDSVLDIAGYACLLDGYLYGEEKNGKEEKRKSSVVEGSGVASVQSMGSQVKSGCAR